MNDHFFGKNKFLIKRMDSVDLNYLNEFYFHLKNSPKIYKHNFHISCFNDINGNFFKENSLLGHPLIILDNLPLSNSNFTVGLSCSHKNYQNMFSFLDNTDLTKIKKSQYVSNFFCICDKNLLSEYKTINQNFYNFGYQNAISNHINTLISKCD